MPEGGKLTIEATNVFADEDYCRVNPEFSPGQYVLICVSDTGCGMPPDVLTRAFEPFFTTKEPGPRHRARAQPSLRLRQAVRRARQNLQRGRPGHDHQDLPAALHAARGERRRRHADDPRRRAGGRGHPDRRGRRRICAAYLRRCCAGLAISVLAAPNAQAALPILERAAAASTSCSPMSSCRG